MEKKIIGYTTGVFDMFHIGHLNLLKRAKSHCDFLIVGVTTDELCINQKGVKTVIPENDRLEIVSSIKYVDNAVFQHNYDKTEAFRKYKFDRMFVGSDWKGSERWVKLEEYFKDFNVQIIYFEYTPGISSSLLRKRNK